MVDLFRLMPEHAIIRTACPIAISIRCSRASKPVIFNFHSYASLVHKLTYNRTNHENMHVHGYREKGNINTPLELAIINEVDRFTLAIDVIDRVPRLRDSASTRRNGCADQIIEASRLRACRRHRSGRRSATGFGRVEFAAGAWGWAGVGLGLGWGLHRLMRSGFHGICILSGLLALPLSGAGLTFFAAAKKVSKESSFPTPILARRR